MSIGKRLYEIRENAGLTCQDASELIGASHGSWWNWENGKATPRDRTLDKIAEEFGVRKEWLESGIGAPTRESEAKRLEEAKMKRIEESRTVHSVEDEARLKDINFLISTIGDMNLPRERKRRIHKTLSAYRTELESTVLFGEQR